MGRPFRQGLIGNSYTAQPTIVSGLRNWLSSNVRDTVHHGGGTQELSTASVGMLPMRVQRAVVGASLILLTASLLLGASSVTGKPIPAMRTIEGKWRGQIKFAGGPYEIFYLTVNSDGSIVASWGVTTRWGKVTLRGGKARFDLHTSSGDLYYYEEKQGRIITLRPDFGGWDAQVR